MVQSVWQTKKKNEKVGKNEKKLRLEPSVTLQPPNRPCNLAFSKFPPQLLRLKFYTNSPVPKFQTFTNLLEKMADGLVLYTFSTFSTLLYRLPTWSNGLWLPSNSFHSTVYSDFWKYFHHLLLMITRIWNSKCYHWKSNNVLFTL